MIRWIKEKIQKYKDTHNTKWNKVNAEFRDNVLNVYLCGPIGKTLIDWRFKFKDTDKIHFVNPENWSYEDPNDLCEADLYAIRKADAVFAYVPVYSPGTSMELFYLKSLKKPVVLSVSKKLLSPWHEYALNVVNNSNRFLFSDVRKAKKFLISFLNGEVDG